jgi:hypothetical protein
MIVITLQNIFRWFIPVVLVVFWLANLYSLLVAEYRCCYYRLLSCLFEEIITFVLTLSNPVFLPTAYSPALICFGRERGWWITCNYPTVLKEKNIEKQKEYNLLYLLAKVRTTWGKASDKLRQRTNKRNKNRVGRLPTSQRNREVIMSDEARRRIGKG